MTAQREDAAIGTVVLTTGGTIASRPDAQGGVVAGEDLVAAVPGLDELSGLVVREVMNVGSYVITPEQMFIIAATARAAAAEAGVAGVVVTHGTDTMEETAYLTDLLHTGPQPIVFTGAQRHAEAHDADGPRNVMDAVRISRSPAARGLGAVIAMAGRIDGAREATKLHTFALEAFGSFEHGRLGEVRDRDVHVYHPRVRPDNLSQIDRFEPNVALIKLVAGIGDSFLRAALATGDSGVVLECFGLGNANHPVLTAVKDAVAAGVTVVAVSRCPSGSVAPVYGNAGGHDLRKAGAIFAGNLSGQKARILLMAALSEASGRDSIEQLLQPHISL